MPASDPPAVTSCSPQPFPEPLARVLLVHGTARFAEHAVSVQIMFYTSSIPKQQSLPSSVLKMHEGSLCTSVRTVGLLGTLIVLLSPGRRKCGVSGLWLVQRPSQSWFSVHLTS